MKKPTNSVKKFDWAIEEVEKLRDFLISIDGDFEIMEEIVKEIRGKRSMFIKDNFFCDEVEGDNYTLFDGADNQEKFKGIKITQNKLIDELSTGYMHYFKTPDGLRKFSSFNWEIL